MSKWFVSRHGKLTGPYALPQLQTMVKSGELKPTDQLCPEGGAPTMAKRVPGLFASEPAAVKPAPAAKKPANPAIPAIVRPVPPPSRPTPPPVRPAPAPAAPPPSATEGTDAAFGMSRLIYWSAMLGGWSALVGWGIAELAIGRYVGESVLYVVVMVVVVATALGAGLSQASGLTAFQGAKQLARLGPGVLGGLIGGAVGGLLGNFVVQLFGQNYAILGFISRVLGWTLLGVAIGVSEGLLELHWRKVRNGLIGGTLGGFIGGLIFNPVSALIGSPVSSRGFAFVTIGLCLGLFVSLVDVLMKEAWLTVEGGFRPGRQLILKQEQTTMGTSEKAGLIFIAFGAKGVEPIHLSIGRQEDGSFVLEDCKSRTGTLLNGTPVREPTSLSDGDLIEFGVNKVRFNLRHRPQQANA